LEIGDPMRTYESIFIIDPELAEEERKELIEKLTRVAIDNEGQVESIEEWGLKRLAYEVKGNKEGFYVFFRLKAPLKAIAELERNYKLVDSVIRYLTVKLE
jgi:small subunit ribosomal protein S6